MRCPWPSGRRCEEPKMAAVSVLAHAPGAPLVWGRCMHDVCIRRLIHGVRLCRHVRRTERNTS
jgi:hypothetical protein